MRECFKRLSYAGACLSPACSSLSLGQDSSGAGLGSDGIVDDRAAHTLTHKAGARGAVDLGRGSACDVCAAASPSVNSLDAAATVSEDDPADIQEDFQDASAGTFALDSEEEHLDSVHMEDREYEQQELEQLAQAEMEDEMSESPL